MNKMRYLLIFSILVLILAACSNNGDDHKTDPSMENTGPDELINEEDEDDEVDEEEEPEEETDFTEGDIDFNSLLKEVESITDGTTNVIYEHNEKQVHDEEQYSVTLDAYVVAEIEDYHMNFSIPFGSDDEGALLLTHFTVENKSDDDIGYSPLWDLRYSGADRFPGPNRQIIPEELQIVSKLNSDNNFVINANEKVSGYFAIPLRTVDVTNIEEVDVAEIVIPEAGDVYDPDNYEFKNKIGSKGSFAIVVNEVGENKRQEDAAFYPDRTTVDNMGDKTMIKEKEEINETKTLENSTITLEGYQFTTFEPNEHEAPRFEDFDTGIVLLNVKLNIENGEDELIDLTGQKAKLTMNNGKQYVLHQLMLSPYRSNDVLESGETSEVYVVFTLDQEQYEKIWQDKPFELEYGPLRSPDVVDLSKGKSIKFELPE